MIYSILLVNNLNLVFLDGIGMHYMIHYQILKVLMKKILL